MSGKGKSSIQNGIVVGHHYDFIDGLRGVAILAVIWFHSLALVYETFLPEMSGFYQYFVAIGFLGLTGVDLFFVISGFLITGILIDTANLEGKYKKFYIRRSLRIFPIYYAFLFLIYFGMNPDGFMFDWQHLQYVLYMQNWGMPFYEQTPSDLSFFNHTWSLAIEEQFYLIWPFLFWSLYKKSVKLVIVTIISMILLSWGLREYICSTGYYKFSYMATFCRLDSLGLGALLSLGFRYYKHHLEWFRLFLMSLFLLSFISLILTASMYDNVDDLIVFIYQYGLTICSVLYASLLGGLLISKEQSLMKRFFSNYYLREIGKISYGMYIIHLVTIGICSNMIFQFEMKFISAHFMLFFAACFISFLLARLSYVYFEQPILAYKDKWASLK